MPLNVPNLDYVRSRDSKLYEILKAIIDGVHNIETGTTVSANSKTATPAPAQVTAVAVTAADGIFQIIITDSGQIRKTVNYFAEYDTDPNFTQPHVVDMGTSRTKRLTLGNLSLYWRAYSQYVGSQPSPPVFFGAPDLVAGGGSAGPALPASTGSGTASISGQQGGFGFGKVLLRHQ